MSIVSDSKRKILYELFSGPKHGYKIAKFTSIPMGSIYDHLAELVEAGFIEYTEENEKKIYRLTKKGEMLLKALE
jgi:DNA-binding PadR family transcriptional regulator